jgi:hypothetical protein
MINGLFSHDQWIINGLSMDCQLLSMATIDALAIDGFQIISDDNY